MLVTINITQKHIDEGQEFNCTSCPVALAITEHLEDIYHANVKSKGFSIYLSLPDDHYFDDKYVDNTYQELPLIAQNLINSFDKYEIIEPISFDLDIPDELLKSK